jgi:hypothetical protein
MVACQMGDDRPEGGQVEPVVGRSEQQGLDGGDF